MDESLGAASVPYRMKGAEHDLKLWTIYHDQPGCTVVPRSRRETIDDFEEVKEGRGLRRCQDCQAILARARLSQ